jgi:16S rRNA G966 N2-methylase RsmD
MTNKTFLDLYAGCGAMGIEAISRGASVSFFVDKCSESISYIKKNIYSLSIEDKCKIYMTPDLSALNLFNENGLKFDVIYLDPPYLITFSEYNKLWNENTERDLLVLLDNLNESGINFAISNVTHYRGRTNTLFLEWSEQYHTHSIKSNYISFNDNSIKQFNEVLVTNY